METRQVDVAIIGAGTAGLTARRAALNHGARDIVMIEGGPYGTTCARVGCMPSKLLIAAADAAHEMRHADQFGVHAPGEPRIDGEAVMSRVQSERNRFAGFVVDMVEALPEDMKLRGWASFVGPTSLEVDSHTRVDAKAVVVAAGTSPWIPPVFADLGDRILTNEHVFELKTIPKSVAVIGTGVIGLELGQALHRLGARVALFNPGENVGPLRDPPLQQLTREILGGELDIKTGTTVHAATRVEDGAKLAWTGPEGDGEETFEFVLVAAGRRPNLSRLNLEAAGIELDERGMPRDFDHRTMQVGDHPIFLAGDIVGERALLHEAADEGRFAGTNAAIFPDVRAHVRRTELSIVFTDPNIATVGCVPPKAHVGTHDFGDIDYSDQGRSRVMGQNRGWVRIWADHEDSRLVGAEMIGPRVEHTAHLLAWAVQQRMTVEQALEMPFYHPVVEEGIRTALRDLAAKLKLRASGRRLEDCSPGS